MTGKRKGSLSRRVTIAPGAAGQVVLDVASPQYAGEWTLWAFQELDSGGEILDWEVQSKGAENVEGTTLFRTGPEGGQTMSASGPFLLRASLAAGAGAPVTASVWLSAEAFKPAWPIEVFSMAVAAGAVFQNAGPRLGYPPPNRHRCSIYAPNAVDVQLLDNGGVAVFTAAALTGVTLPGWASPFLHMPGTRLQIRSSGAAAQGALIAWEE